MTEDVTEQPERKFVYRIKNRADAPNLIGPLNTHPYIKKAELNYVKLFQSQSITFLEIPAKTIDDDSFQLVASSSSGLPVTFESLHPEIATVTPAGQVTILTNGAAIIRATQGGNSNYEPAPNYDRKLVVTKRSQAIEFGQLETVNLSDEQFVLAATASSGLPVSYTLSDETIASIGDNSTLTLLKGGQVIITAAQEGNEFYEAAESVDLILNVTDDQTDSDGDGIPDIADPFPNQQPQVITWDQTFADFNAGDQVALTATSNSGLTVRYTSSNTNVAIISGSELLFLKAGQSNITAIQQGNEEYLAANPVTKTIAVNQEQVMTWNQQFASDTELLSGDITLNASVDTGLPITYSVSDETIISVNGSVLSLVAVGTAQITATQAGDPTATPAILPVSIIKEITIVDNLTDSDGDGIPDSSDPYPNQIERPNFVWNQDLSEVTDVVTLTATSDSGTIVYELGNETLGTIAGNVFTPSTTVAPPTPLSVGITATIAEDETYKTAIISKTITLKDSDGDGYPDNNDEFPNDSSEWSDRDGDGVGDNADAFPDDPTETSDRDGDGVGDNADAFPDDPNETSDRDGDGVGDNADAFPDDPSETTDSDGDGVGDNSDAYPNDPSRSVDLPDSQISWLNSDNYSFTVGDQVRREITASAPTNIRFSTSEDVLYTPSNYTQVTLRRSRMLTWDQYFTDSGKVKTSGFFPGSVEWQWGYEFTNVSKYGYVTGDIDIRKADENGWTSSMGDRFILRNQTDQLLRLHYFCDHISNNPNVESLLIKPGMKFSEDTPGMTYEEAQAQEEYTVDYIWPAEYTFTDSDGETGYRAIILNPGESIDLFPDLTTKDGPLYENIKNGGGDIWLRGQSSPLTFFSQDVSGDDQLERTQEWSGTVTATSESTSEYDSTSVVRNFNVGGSIYGENTDTGDELVVLYDQSMYSADAINNTLDSEYSYYQGYVDFRPKLYNASGTQIQELSVVEDGNSNLFQGGARLIVNYGTLQDGWNEIKFVFEHPNVHQNEWRPVAVAPRVDITTSDGTNYSSDGQVYQGSEVQQIVEDYYSAGLDAFLVESNKPYGSDKRELTMVISGKQTVLVSLGSSRDHDDDGTLNYEDPDYFDDAGPYTIQVGTYTDSEGYQDNSDINIWKYDVNIPGYVSMSSGDSHQFRHGFWVDKSSVVMPGKTFSHWVYYNQSTSSWERFYFNRSRDLASGGPSDNALQSSALGDLQLAAYYV